jgi:uncharacterized protein (DUF983 family)
VSEHGIRMYDLAGNWCEECGRAKSFRLWPGGLTGCKTCDEVVTRHRCTGRPSLASLVLGESWTCPDCGTIWTAVEVEDTCGECGRSGMEPGWSYVPGDRIDTAPRHKPEPFTPFRNRFASSSRCYKTPGGSMVHVKPGCRC